MPKKVTAANRKKFLADLHEHLLEMKTKLITEIDSELRSERERVKIKQIDDALLRMDEGSYGVCESCGLEVAEERLEAMPFTRLCRDCQQDQEKEAKSQRRFDEERNTYRKIGSTDADEEKPESRGGCGRA